MPDKDDFSTTMRIDITSHIPDKQDAKPVRKVTALPKTQIVKKKLTPRPGLQTVGGKDFHELLQNIYDGALITTEDGNIVNANARALTFFQYPKEELCSRKIFDVMIGADEALLGTILENLENNQFTLIQAFCVRQDESVFPAEISVNHLNLSNASYLSFFVRDITLRREAEDQLRTGFNAIQNSANGIAIADLEGNLVYANSAMRQALGLAEQEDVDERPFGDFVADPESATGIVEAVNRQMCWRGELVINRPNGRELHVDTSVAPNTNTDGEITGMVISLVDITGKKMAQRKLEQYALELAERNKQMEDDLDLARDIQEALLPRHYPECRDAEQQRRLDYASVYYPSGAIGGDFFDVLEISKNETGIFVCDVMGHGMRAALVVATIRGIVEQLGEHAHDPGLFMTKLNAYYNAIFAKMKDVIFATAFYCVVDVRTGEARYISAGHPPPYIIRKADQSVEQLDPAAQGIKSPAIGLFDSASFQNQTLQLNLGDLLVLYTDGLTESMNEKLEAYEDGSMQAWLRRNAANQPEDILKGMAEDARAFSGKTEFADDVCLFGLKISPEES